jgi:hypothetical protein
MKTLVLSWLLHHANRFGKDNEFYAVKDRILTKHGKHVGYDVQHIEGKKCFTCHGTGKYDKWDQYGIYDPDWCWHCAGNGFYKDPQWICLSRINFGGYIFHKPLKRERCIKNPFTKIGWMVSDRSIITGYIKHEPSFFAVYCLMVLFLIYNRVELGKTVSSHINNIKGRCYWKWHKLKRRFISPPPRYEYINDPDSDLPF